MRRTYSTKGRSRTTRTRPSTMRTRLPYLHSPFFLAHPLSTRQLSHAHLSEDLVLRDIVTDQILLPTITLSDPYIEEHAQTPYTEHHPPSPETKETKGPSIPSRSVESPTLSLPFIETYTYLPYSCAEYPYISMQYFRSFKDAFHLSVLHQH